jgi:hypothetical protein
LRVSRPAEVAPSPPTLLLLFSSAAARQPGSVWGTSGGRRAVLLVLLCMGVSLTNGCCVSGFAGADRQAPTKAVGTHPAWRRSSSSQAAQCQQQLRAPDKTSE